MRIVREQWFSLVVMGLFAAAWALPGLGAALNPDRWTENAAIALIFLVSGLSLRTEDALRALGAWKLHALIQGISFVLLPAVAWAVVHPLANRLPEGLVVGFYLLAAVPMTITTCVVFTQLAGGNTAGALFNSVAANIAGIFISPALVRMMLGVSQLSIEIDARRVLVKLSLIVLLPLVLGQLFHRRALALPGLKRWFSLVNRVCILLIIYLAFAGLFARDRGSLPPWRSVVVPLALLPVVHLLLLVLCDLSARMAGFSRRDRIAVIFCAPQKTLALGLPMAAAMLADRPELIGLATLPILVYHPVQLITAGFLQQRFARGAPTR